MVRRFDMTCVRIKLLWPTPARPLAVTTGTFIFDNTVSTIILRGETNSMSVGKSWDNQRQAEAMINHNIARDLNNDLQEAAAQIKTKFLIVIGDDDRVVAPQPAREFGAMIGATVLELDEDCGHGDPWCAPDAFALAVSNFIDKD